MSDNRHRIVDSSDRDFFAGGDRRELPFPGKPPVEGGVCDLEVRGVGVCVPSGRPWPGAIRRTAAVPHLNPEIRA